MATITSLGVGSGLDIDSLVRQLVAAERSAKDNRIARTDAKLTTEFTALATLKGAMSALQATTETLRIPGSFAQRTTTSGDDQIVTGSATQAAVAGSYQVQVAQLATAARLGSGAYADGSDSVVGTGTLTITTGTSSFSIDIAEGGNSLAQVRDAINSAAGSSGVRATLIHDTAGSWLVLAGSETGAANAISVNASGADAGLQQLADDLNAFDAARDVVAQDAIAYVSGYEIRSSSNVVTGAIDGVTLNLKKVTAEGETVTFTVQRDDAQIQQKAEAFIAAYNTLAKQMASLGSYDATTQTAGPMLGDSLLRGVQSQLRRIVTEPVAGIAGSYGTLAGIGIEVSLDGTLKLDAAQFQAALAAEPDAVSRVFSSQSGVAARMDDLLDQRLSASGELATRNERISTQRARLKDEKEALDARMAVVQQRYLRQFNAMDTMLAQLQSTSTYLTQQLESLANLAKKAGDS